MIQCRTILNSENYSLLRRKGGYPNSDEDCPARDRLIADIVTVVDALDAGTDNIGRCYAAAKDYDQLVGELQSGKNTRYAPEIVRLFDDSAILNR